MIMFVSRRHWDTYKKNIAYKGSKLYLIMASMDWAKAPYQQLTHAEYVNYTGTRLNQFKKLKTEMIRFLESDKKNGKSYIKFDESIFKIPIKHTYELQVYHYVITKRHDSKHPLYDFNEFVERYSVSDSRDSKHKFKKIIKNLTYPHPTP